MTNAEFDRQFVRLSIHFHLPQDERDTIQADWFAAMKHFHVEAFDHAVTELVRTATERYWPALGRVMEIIKARIGRYDRTPGECLTCGGSGWVEASAFKSNGLIYSNALMRCQHCGIPAPAAETHSRRSVLTDIEAHEHAQGRYGRDQMPDGLKAKHPEKLGNPEFKAWAEQLRVKLFGVQEDAS